MYNETHMLKQFLPHVLEVTILIEVDKKERIILRIPIISTDFLFEFKQFHFMVKLSFGMTINKSQRQSLKITRLNLTSLSIFFFFLLPWLVLYCLFYGRIPQTFSKLMLCSQKSCWIRGLYRFCFVYPNILSYLRNILIYFPTGQCHVSLLIKIKKYSSTYNK